MSLGRFTRKVGVVLSTEQTLHDECRYEKKRPAKTGLFFFFSLKSPIGSFT